MKSDIPLLISKGEMKKHNVVIDTSDDTVIWDGKEAETIPTSSGNICISILPNKEANNVLTIQTEFKKIQSNEEREKALDTLERIN